MKIQVTGDALIDRPLTQEELAAIKEDVEDCLRFTGYGRSIWVEVEVKG